MAWCESELTWMASSKLAVSPNCPHTQPWCSWTLLQQWQAQQGAVQVPQQSRWHSLTCAVLAAGFPCSKFLTG